MKLTYFACFYPVEGGQYVVDIPDLGCSTQGFDLSNAIEMAADAAAGWIIDSLDHGESLPKPSDINDILPESGGFVSAVLIDLDELSKNYSSKLVKKTVNIPEWANAAGEKRKINFSAALTDAIIQQLTL
jgi:predicted RNase H-like HicB family nuclease